MSSSSNYLITSSVSWDDDDDNDDDDDLQSQSIVQILADLVNGEFQQMASR